MYSPKDAADLAATAPGFDTLLYTAAPPPELGFATLACFGKTCVARRPGRLRASAGAGDAVPAGCARVAAAARKIRSGSGELP